MELLLIGAACVLLFLFISNRLEKAGEKERAEAKRIQELKTQLSLKATEEENRVIIEKFKKNELVQQIAKEYSAKFWERIKGLDRPDNRDTISSKVRVKAWTTQISITLDFDSEKEYVFEDFRYPNLSHREAPLFARVLCEEIKAIIESYVQKTPIMSDHNVEVTYECKELYVGEEHTVSYKATNGFFKGQKSW